MKCILYMMDFTLKKMHFTLKMIDFTLKMMNFRLKLMESLQAALGEGATEEQICTCSGEYTSNKCHSIAGKTSGEIEGFLTDGLRGVGTELATGAFFN